MAACRVLGRYDRPDVYRAPEDAVGNAQGGSPVWSVCTVARARLRVPDALLKLNGAIRSLEGPDLLDAVRVMVDTGHEQADFLLRKVTREAPPVVRLQAAQYIVPSDAEYASGFAVRGLQDDNPKVRAQALVLERALARAPAAPVRYALTDADDLVQLRAAEAILAWADRLKNRGNY
jgi:hypothetical protein